MCSRHQSKYTRSLHLVTNTLFMAAFIDFVRSLGNQWMAQPFSKFMFWYWFSRLVSSCLFWNESFFYRLGLVFIIYVLFYLLRVATKHKWIPNVTEWKHVDPTTLKTMIHSHTEIMMTFSYAEKNDPPDAPKRADPHYYRDIAKKRAKEEAAWGEHEIATVNDDVLPIAVVKRNKERTGGDNAGGANPSPAGDADLSSAQGRRTEILRILTESQVADSQAADSQEIAPPNARGKRPRAEAGAQVRKVAARGPQCPVCNAVSLTKKFVGIGMCGGCDKKNKPKKKK